MNTAHVIGLHSTVQYTSVINTDILTMIMKVGLVYEIRVVAYRESKLVTYQDECLRTSTHQVMGLGVDHFQWTRVRGPIITVDTCVHGV